MFTFNKNVTAIDNLSEEEQAKNIRFAFCQAKNNGYYYNTTAWVMCRDFLNDVHYTHSYTQENKQSIHVEIYGFHYTSTIFKKANILAIISNDVADLNKIQMGIKNIINKLEIQMYPNKNRTFYSIQNEKYTDLPVLLIHPSSIWLKNTYTLSLFTLFIRLFTYEQADKNIWKSIITYSKCYSTNDTYMVHSLQKKSEIINSILLNLTETPNPVYPDTNIYTIHDKSGILSATYNKEFTNIIKKWVNKECPQDVKDVILF
jgi:hypothetical protein